MILDIIGKPSTAYVAIIGRSGPFRLRGRGPALWNVFTSGDGATPCIYVDFHLCRRIIYPSA